MNILIKYTYYRPSYFYDDLKIGNKFLDNIPSVKPEPGHFIKSPWFDIKEVNGVRVETRRGL